MIQLTPERIEHYRKVLSDRSAEFWGLGLVLGSIQKDKGSGDWIQFVTDYMTAMELDDSGLLDDPSYLIHGNKVPQPHNHAGFRGAHHDEKP